MWGGYKVKILIFVICHVLWKKLKKTTQFYHFWNWCPWMKWGQVEFIICVGCFLFNHTVDFVMAMQSSCTHAITFPTHALPFLISHFSRHTKFTNHCPHIYNKLLLLSWENHDYQVFTYNVREYQYNNRREGKNLNIN